MPGVSETVIVAIIGAVAAAGTAVYTTNQARSTADKQMDAQKAAAAAQQAANDKAARLASAQNSADAPKTIENSPDVAAQMKAKLAADESAGGGFSPSFYTSDLDASFPGYESMTQQVTANTLAGK